MAMYSPYVPWFFTMGVPTFGNLRVEAYLQLTAAYRSLSRPSSAPNAKAFSICSSSLELLLYIDLNILLGSLYAWIAVFFILAVKRHSFSMIAFLWQNCFLPYYGKTWFRYSRLLVFSLYFVCHVLLFSYSVFNEHRLTLVKLQSNLSFLKSLWRSTKISLRYTS